ncbi:unnamed protein product, partial [Discosporangium mesarthrocarpum]
GEVQGQDHGKGGGQVQDQDQGQGQGHGLNVAVGSRVNLNGGSGLGDKTVPIKSNSQHRSQLFVSGGEAGEGLRVLAEAAPGAGHREREKEEEAPLRAGSEAVATSQDGMGEVKEAAPATGETSALTLTLGGTGIDNGSGAGGADAVPTASARGSHGFSGFRTGVGREIKVSSEALARVDHLFCDSSKTSNSPKRPDTSDTIRVEGYDGKLVGGDRGGTSNDCDSKNKANHTPMGCAPASDGCASFSVSGVFSGEEDRTMGGSLQGGSMGGGFSTGKGRQILVSECALKQVEHIFTTGIDTSDKSGLSMIGDKSAFDVSGKKAKRDVVTGVGGRGSNGPSPNPSLNLDPHSRIRARGGSQGKRRQAGADGTNAAGAARAWSSSALLPGDAPTTSPATQIHPGIYRGGGTPTGFSTGGGTALQASAEALARVDYLFSGSDLFSGSGGIEAPNPTTSLTCPTKGDSTEVHLTVAASTSTHQALDLISPVKPAPSCAEAPFTPALQVQGHDCEHHQEHQEERGLALPATGGVVKSVSISSPNPNLVGDRDLTLSCSIGVGGHSAGGLSRQRHSGHKRHGIHERYRTPVARGSRRTMHRRLVSGSTDHCHGGSGSRKRLFTTPFSSSKMGLTPKMGSTPDVSSITLTSPNKKKTNKQRIHSGGGLFKKKRSALPSPLPNPNPNSELHGQGCGVSPGAAATNPNPSPTVRAEAKDWTGSTVTGKEVAGGDGGEAWPLADRLLDSSPKFNTWSCRRSLSSLLEDPHAVNAPLPSPLLKESSISEVAGVVEAETESLGGVGEGTRAKSGGERAKTGEGDTAGNKAGSNEATTAVDPIGARVSARIKETLLGVSSTNATGVRFAGDGRPCCFGTGQEGWGGR